MTLTARDRKLVAMLLVLAVAAGYWFLILGPKREQAQIAAEELTEQEERRDAALATVARFQSARSSFAADYAAVVRLGKAIPSEADVPSLMVQLEEAADGAGIEFDSITVGERSSLAAAPASTPDDGTSAPADAQPVASTGGEPAEAPTAETTAPEATTSEAPTTGTTAPDASTSEPATPDSTAPQSLTSPSATTQSPPGDGAPGLESVSLEFSFQGDFFDLADLFHELKRFVDVRGDRIEVDGRLLTVDAISLSPSEKGSELTAAISTRAYLAPAAEGTTAGATPAGPAGAAPSTSQAASEPAPAPDTTPPPATGTTPTAGDTP